MDKLLLDAEKVDLSAQDIIDITNGDVKIMLYEDLQDMNSINEVFGNKNNVALLYETEQNFGHWVGLLKYDDTIEFFDPYGMSPDEELKYAPYHIRKNEQGELIPHLSELLNNSGKKLIYNNVKVQQWKQDVNTCGRHIACRIKLKHYPLREYLTLMTKNKFYDADMWVSALTIMYSL